MRWAVLAVILYTLFLLLLGRRAMERARGHGEQFLTGGRRVSGLFIFTMIAGLWCSSLAVTVMETAYDVGASAFWFGMGTVIMSALAAGLFLTPFHRIGFTTNSALIGQRFGRTAQLVAGVVIGLTFPIFAMGPVLAAGIWLHVATSWPVALTLAAPLAVIVLYVAMGGMWSLAYTQPANLAALVSGFLVAAWVVLRHVRGVTATPTPHLWAGLASHQPAGFGNLFGVGPGLILVWIIGAMLNVVSAQAEFQLLSSSHSPRAGRLAVWATTPLLIAVSAVATALGMALRSVAPSSIHNGLLAFPLVILHVAPVWAKVLVILGVWAAALNWSAPLLFSGAVSLGADVGGLLLRGSKKVSTRQLICFTLPLQAMALLAYALIRPQDLAWWSVFGLTLRNATIVIPTLAFLLWPAGGRRAAVASMLCGAASGLAWNAVTGFSPTRFLFGIHPMWLAMGVAVATFAVGTLWEHRGSWQPVVEAGARWRAMGVVMVGVAAGGTIVWMAGALRSRGLVPLGALLVLFGLAGSLALSYQLRGPGGDAEAGTMAERGSLTLERDRDASDAVNLING